MTTCGRIGLIVHTGRQAAVDAAARVYEWAREAGVPVVEMDVWDAAATRRSAKSEMEAGGNPDLVVTIGGDGTFLRGVRVAVARDVPVLGVNVGRVGFLTEVEPAELRGALEAYADDRTFLEERLLLGLTASRQLDVPGGIDELLRFGRGPALPPVATEGDTDPRDGFTTDVAAVNDIVFEKLARDRQASLGVYVDGRLFASYSADALIVASPTGSTAYSFAAGGPVLSPRLRALVFTPVAPHMAFNRSLILAPEESVGVRVLEHSGQVAVSIDGQVRGVVGPGDWLSVSPSPHVARLVRVRRSDFYARLRDRFGLADAPAASADGTAPVSFLDA
ncbi:NAD+ kinase [Motilibacter peucedani]|uniref:NAD kinase n=1 Tax=Motilibacter peucedani TaxID=598650 RepID=A0A420XQU8_9ACTN|nr:NAD(+)/NADH kinase [Motilibacter peucedani]RKS75617.1 NAD+ kinase [Motilibacter peucedani]